MTILPLDIVKQLNYFANGGIDVYYAKLEEIKRKHSYEKQQRELEVV